MNSHAVLAPIFQRSHGEAVVAMDCVAGKARLVRLGQKGSAKAILPQEGDVPELVFLNTSGGLTGGDTLSLQLMLGAIPVPSRRRRRRNVPTGLGLGWRGFG
jgi:urease accessory protein